MSLAVQLSDCHSRGKSFLNVNNEDFSQQKKEKIFFPHPRSLG